jgi:ATP:guanido phosphotransferase, C-terminal catalytic domain
VYIYYHCDAHAVGYIFVCCRSHSGVQFIQNVYVITIYAGTDLYEVASHVSDNWPLGRGLWYTDDMRLVIWINEHDHIRVTTTEEVQITSTY